MKKIYFSFLLTLISLASSAALYTSPGTGVKWTLAQLAANSGGLITMSGADFLVQDSITIATGDTLDIAIDAVVKFADNTVFRVNGVLFINPPNAVLFTALNPLVGFRGVFMENSIGSAIKNMTYEYASSFRLSDSSPSFDNCTFRYNNNSTVLSNGTLSLFRSNPVITNCNFIDNFRAAIQGGANIANAPRIINSIFSGNNRSNQNVPHINLGASGTDTTRIIGCQITNPAGIRTGAIGFLPLGNLNVFIHGNLIANNRYGISLQGATINALVSYNRIENNNIENNPNLGGSGIAFAGGTATVQQNSIVTGNVFSNNLWGITIQNRAKPNLGNVQNADTTDDGKNIFINNTNGNTPFVDLYNNSIDTIYAQGNYWNTSVETEVESKIFHKADQASLGPVIYKTYALPFNNVNLIAEIDANDVLLKWQTTNEFYTSRFIVEKSADNVSFSPVDTVAAAGLSFSLKNYNSIDEAAFANNATIYYRLKMFNLAGDFVYSDTAFVKFANIPSTGLEQYYPTILNASQPWTIKIQSPYRQSLRLAYFAADGKFIKFIYLTLVPGFNQFTISTDSRLPQGWNFIKVSAIGLTKTIPILIH